MIYCVKQKFPLTSPTVLLSEHYYRRLWLAVRNLDIPRRSWLDELADTFRDFGGQIVKANGQCVEVPFVDDVFGDDTDMRWLGYFLLSDISGQHPRSRSRKIERLQILDLYFRIKHPKIARHFAK